MRFADPELLILLVLVPLFLLLRTRLSREYAAGVFSSLALLGGFGRTWRLRYRWLPTAVRVLALILLIVALARPQTSLAEADSQTEGIDIALILDTSTSMSGGFGQGSRLGEAQRVLKDFIDGRSDDRLGLVIFRSTSLVLSPLTLDYEALALLVDEVEQVNLTDGTAIGDGLADALNLLRESRARSRVAVLLTDGQNNSGSVQPLAAARIAEALGIRVYTIGMIDQGVSSSGVSNVDARALEEVANLTDGRYFPVENEDALETIYAGIDQLEKSRIDSLQFVQYRETAGYFLAAALALLVLELVLRSTIWKSAA